MRRVRAVPALVAAALALAACAAPPSVPPAAPSPAIAAVPAVPRASASVPAAAGTVPARPAPTSDTTAASTPSLPPTPLRLSAPLGVATLAPSTAPPALILTDIAFAAPSTGWIVADRSAGGLSLPPQVPCGYPVGVSGCAEGGEILATVDGGHAWHVVWTQAAPLYHVRFVAPERGWAWGPDGLVLTTDGGRRWTPVGLPGPGALQWVGFSGTRGVWMLLADGAWANATHPAAALFRSRNGGADWTLSARTAAYPVHQGRIAPGLGQPSLPPAVAPGTLGSPAGWQAFLAGPPWATYLGFSAAFSGRSGWAIGSDSAKRGTTIYATSDGGVRWRRLSHTGALLAALRPARGALWALTEPGPYPTSAASCPSLHQECGSGVARSVSGGRNWQTAPAPAGTELTALAPLGPRSAFALAVRGHAAFAVLHTADGGRSWKTLYVAPHAFGPTWRLGFWNARDGWGYATAVDPGAVLRTVDGGAAWTVVGEAPRGTDGFQVSFSGPQSGWVQTGSGPDPGTFTTADGGTAWAEVAGPGPVLYGSWQFLGGGHGYALVASGVGRRPNLDVTADGGRRWTPIPLPAAFRALSMSDRRVGWAVAVPRPPLPGVAGSGTPAAGQPAAVLEQTVDGGRRWRAVVRLGTRGQWVLIGALAAPGPDTLWLLDSLDPFAGTGTGAASPGPPVLLRSVDGGQAWSGLRLPSALGYPQAFAAADASTAWEITGEGNLWTTTDGGAVWRQVAEGA